ncbi:hypothetical secreted protein [Azoarcus olearius]|uniref:Hypothetical secreted protein n=1 Tax=Azoarcus sp. (strain BH72) TaxID=418699 RepID=A1K3I9_AZOSB|nr:hypothetical protein dqs_0847 [Azoarcus olearius]CAL93394.1 hypothetical secreted protein [Azoarcus olearius]
MRALRSLFVVLLLLPLAAGGVLASLTRSFPPDAQRVVMVFAGAGTVKIKAGSFFKSDRVLTLSPGAQIRDTDNRIVMPTAIAGEYKVRAQIDNAGQVHRVWVLTPAEIAVVDPKQ